MRIIVAPDSFKGSLSAVGVATAIEQGILSVWPQAEVKMIPIADGGEGTVEALVTATGGRILHEKVMGPLGDSVEAHWGLLGDNETALKPVLLRSSVQCDHLVRGYIISQAATAG